MKDSKRILTAQEVLTIPFYPMGMLTHNLRSHLAAEINDHTQGGYNHWLWMIGPGIGASQDLFFKRVNIEEEYLQGCHRIKFWYCPTWTEDQRGILLEAILKDLDKPWYRRIYDWPAIVGQYLNLPWLQVPGIDICSDKARHLSVIDPRYNLNHPDPQDINAWLQKTEGYEVYGRYLPD